MNCPECNYPMHPHQREGLFQKYICMWKTCRIESIKVEFRGIDN